MLQTVYFLRIFYDNAIKVMFKNTSSHWYIDKKSHSISDLFGKLLSLASEV